MKRFAFASSVTALLTLATAAGYAQSKPAQAPATKATTGTAAPDGGSNMTGKGRFRPGPNGRPGPPDRPDGAARSR